MRFGETYNRVRGSIGTSHFGCVVAVSVEDGMSCDRGCFGLDKDVMKGTNLIRSATYTPSAPRQQRQ